MSSLGLASLECRRPSSSSSSAHSRKAQSSIRQFSLRPRFLSGGSSRAVQTDCAGGQRGSTSSISSRQSLIGHSNSSDMPSFYTAQSHDNSSSALSNPPDEPLSCCFSSPAGSPPLGMPPQILSVLEEELRLAHVQTGSLERFGNLRLRQLGIPTGPLRRETLASSTLSQSAEPDVGMRPYRTTRTSSFRRSLTNLFSRLPGCGSPAGFEKFTIGNS